MGFWDLVKKGAKAAVEKIKDFNDDFQKYKMKYETYDTERLKSLYCSSYGAKKWLLLVFLKKEE